jgi:hypothetical protein
MSELTDKWKKLRHEIGNLICAVDGKIEKIDAEEKRMEQKRDESYLKGTEDMRKAVNMLYDARNIGLTPQKMEDLFGTYYIPSILSRFAAIDIINGLKLILKEKDQEFKVGDEVEYSNPINGSCNKYIVIKADSDSSVLWLLDLRTFLRIWIYKDDSSLKKTGKHFDTIDIPEGGATI